MDFQLDPVLSRDTIPVTSLADCQLLLMNDSRFPWCILVPAQPGLSELHELPEGRRGEVLELACELSRRMSDAFTADKMNVAALGNVVAQLHIHIIVRKIGDVAWPAPVWGSSPALPYTHELRGERLRQLLACVGDLSAGPTPSPATP